MPVRVAEIGLYTSIETDDRGLPVSGSKITDGVIPRGLKQFVLYLRLTGDPGSYLLTSNVKSYNEEPAAKFSAPDQTVVLGAGGGEAHVMLDIDIVPLPIGKYMISIALDARPLSDLIFSVGH